MKSKWLIIIVVVFICAVVIVPIVHHQRLIHVAVEETFKSRNELMRKFIALQRDRVAVMAGLFSNQYQLFSLESDSFSSMSPLMVQEHSELGVWQLRLAEDAAGQLTGVGNLPLSANMEREIRAALAMDIQIKPTLLLDNEVLWVYFLSANQFIYIAPATPEHNFHFTPALYERDYWRNAKPDMNQDRHMIIEGVYEDMADRGKILVFAQPVYASDQFLGVAALDLSVDTLRQIADISSTPGQSALVNAQGKVIAQQAGFRADEDIKSRLDASLQGWRKDKNGDVWLSSPIVGSDLWLVHRLTRSELYAAIARESLGVWGLVIILVVLASVSLRLRNTLTEVTRLTRVDPLTQALNRRGFFEDAERVIAIAKRKGAALGVLMMDIDHFKKINDNYGHAEGDSVLKQLGLYVNKARRPYDVFCRWGGEEFLLLLLLDRVDDALAVAERMRAEAQRSTIKTDNSAVYLSGGLVIMRDTESLEVAINRADELLYQSKQTGRNRITFSAD